VIFDDDHYYLGAIIALKLAQDGLSVRYVTTEGRAAAWSQYTQEQERTQRALIEHGVDIECNVALAAFGESVATLACVFSGRTHAVPASSVVLVTSREPNDTLFLNLGGSSDEEPDAPATESRRFTLRQIGDCQQPALIATAVYSGHRAARELDGSGTAMRRERVCITGWPADP
jgi:dimethylamine/trimethylamine dehydrogenase